MSDRNDPNLWAPGPSKVGPTPDPFPDRLRFLRILGEGAFGQVWLAEQIVLARHVAVKTLRAASCNPRAAREALQRDAAHLARFQHPNVVTVHDLLFTPPGDGFLVLQYVDGGSLADRLERHGPLDWQSAARYVADAADGLIEVHRLGIVHRDIKPANILWQRDRDEALLTDFGVSALRTEPGCPAGTLPFMAPEAFTGALSAAMDVYSLAASFFQLVTAHYPFPGPRPLDFIGQIDAGLPDPDPRCAALPEELEEIIRAGLAFAPERRPRLEHFAEQLRATLNRLVVDTFRWPAGALAGQTGVNLRLRVYRAEGSTFRLVQTTQPITRSILRDIQKVPQAPDRVPLHTGDRLRLEVQADRAGYITLLDVGPTGNLNLLFPEPSAATLVARHGAVVDDVQLAPPAGRERLAALWSRQPLALAPRDLASLAASGTRVSTPYLGTRDVLRVRQTLDAMPPGDWQVQVLELDHQPR